MVTAPIRFSVYVVGYGMFRNVVIEVYVFCNIGMGIVKLLFEYLCWYIGY